MATEIDTLYVEVLVTLDTAPPPLTSTFIGWGNPIF